MKRVPIVILAYDSVILRAYLSVFKEMNIQPEKIVVVLFNKLPQQNSKLLASYLPNPIKNKFLQRAIDKKMNFYPRFIKNKFPKTFASIAKVLQEHYAFTPSFLKSIDSQVPYTEFCEDVTFLSIDDYKDKKFIDFINKINTKTLFLYTGGGILPASAFNNALVKYLHVHPGYLPFVRGADCYLWSILLHNKIGASSFFMSAGIDEGNILVAEQFPTISIPVSNDFDCATRNLYRTVYSYFDPCLRAQVLKSTLRQFDNIWDQMGTIQSSEEGDTFYFMNDFLKDMALKKICSPRIVVEN